VVCTVHIFCGPEIWVKVVCHNDELFFASLLWKKARSTGLLKTSTSVGGPAGMKQQKALSRRQADLPDLVSGVGETNLHYLMPWMANGKTGSIAEAPPSTYSNWPVMKLAWSVQRRTTALPTSAG
jgi:hypothetical protein